MRQYSFVKVEVWQLSKKLVKDIYITTNNFPDLEKFGITNQLRRAMVSVSNNIVEGTARSTVKEKKHFIGISYGSTLEVLNLLILSHDLELIEESILSRYRERIEELTNKMNALRNNIR